MEPITLTEQDLGRSTEETVKDEGNDIETPKVRAALTSKKNDDFSKVGQSHGKRGREPQKHFKGKESIKKKLKLSK